MPGRTLFALALAMLCSGVIATSTAAGEFQDLGIPVTKAGLMGAMVGPDARGENTRLYFNFNQSGAPMFIVQVDPSTGEAKQYNAPPGNPGGWGFIVGPDKKIYVGTGGGGNILCFDPAKPDRGLYLIGKPSATEDYIWQFAIGTDNKLYGCTYGNAKLISYDPATGEMKDLGRMDPQEQYSRSVAAGQDGLIYVGIGTVNADFVVYDPATGEHHGLFPEDKRPQGQAMVYRGRDGIVYGRLGDQWYRLDRERATEIPEKQWPGTEPVTLADGRLLSAADLSGNYRLTDNKTGKSTSHKFTYRGAGSGIFVVGAGPKGVIYGSTAMPLEMFSYDPASAKLENPGNPTAVGGEVYSFATWHDELFICAYPGSYLSRYDPAKPWSFGEKPDSNPRGFGRLGDGHLRPRAMIVGPDENLYIGSYPPYGQWGGAMGVWDPRTNKLVENYRNLVQDQAIVSLAYDPKSGLVFGGSATSGGGGTTPRAKEACFFVWDPVKKEKTLELTPVPGAAAIIAMCVANDKVFLLASASPHLSVFDIAQRKIIHQAPITFGTPLDTSMQLHRDGRIYALTGTSIITMDPQTYEIREFARSPVGTGCGWAMTDTGIYFGSDVHLWRYKW